MSKFKVGDKVVGNAKASKRYVITGTGYGATVTRLTARGEIQLNDVWFVDPECFDLIKSVNPTTYELHITCNDGKTTNAVYKVNGKIEKRTQAICAPSDTFDFATGVLTSIDRMFLKTEPVAQPAQDKPKFEVGQKVKVIGNCCSHGYKNGDVLTLLSARDLEPARGRNVADWNVENGAWYISEQDFEPYTEPEQPKYLNMRVVCTDNGGSNYFEIGRVYQFVDGVIFGAQGFYSSKYETLEAANARNGIGSKFIEFKG